MAYNVKNQTESVTPPGGQQLSMTYFDADQTERATRDQHRFAYDLIGLSAETDQGSGNPHTTYFTRDNEGTLVGARETSGALHYYLFDGLGSIVALVNPSGALSDTYAYEPYGKLLSSTGTTEDPFRFAYLDSQVGWLKFGTRYYEPGIARWTQKDPIMTPGNPASVNPYEYVGGDPVNRADPTGLYQIGGGFSQLAPTNVLASVRKALSPAEAVFATLDTLRACLEGAAAFGFIGFVVGSFFGFGVIGAAIGLGAGCLTSGGARGTEIIEEMHV
jgi:RHS repeat-associated protein